MPNDDKKAIFGGCLCRAVRYRSVDRPLVARVCWCRVCQYLATGNGSVNGCFLRDGVTIEGRLSKEQWIVGADYSATDMVIFPWIQVLRRALNRNAAAELGARFLPMERNYPALARWIERIESLPGYENTYPPHWR